MESERFAFRWKEFNSSIVSGFHESLVRGDLVDVTLAVEGQLIKAHRLVLSACSPYFRRMFTAMPENQHAIVFLKDVSHSLLMDLITFMYCGEINVKQEVLPILLSLAEALEIQGFSHHTFNESQKTLPVKQADTNVVIKTEPKDTCDNYAEEQEFIEIESSINSLCTEKSLDHSKQYNENLQRLRPNSPRSDQMNSAREESILIKSESEMEETITTGNTVSDWNINGLLDENFQTSSWDQGPSSSSNYIPHPVSQVKKMSSLQEIENLAQTAYAKLLPAKSAQKYEIAYNKFMNWCNELKLEISENTILVYFEKNFDNQKASTRWSIYSMLKSTLKINKDIDISKYYNLLAYLKQTSVGYRAKKARILVREEIEKFLREAPDQQYLFHKVVLIVGIYGGCRTNELTNILITNIQEKTDYISITIPDTKTNKPRTLLITEGDVDGVNMRELFIKYKNLRPNTTIQRFFLKYCNGKCVLQVVGVNTMGEVPKKIAKFLNLPNFNEYTGHSFRRSSTTMLAN